MKKPENSRTNAHPEFSKQDFVKNAKEYTFKAMQMMKRYGWTESQGLGKNAHGMKEILLGDAQSLGFGLGFEDTIEDHQILVDNEEMSKDERTGLPFDKETKMEIPPLSQTFRSIGWLNERRRQSVEETEMATEKVFEHTICATMEEIIESYPWIRTRVHKKRPAGQESKKCARKTCETME
ncbi:hypothetical protein COLO4_29307 [Corchorus olitorius]|uniref:G-patch domain-containing protein n=1 Tax=Corchorus olitorius TaxID=93759 RepID=A0A1R3HF93_9ROSI|nr:hypothetical protein COLO4_29307 [Corchorus olitorius]